MLQVQFYLRGAEKGTLEDSFVIHCQLQLEDEGKRDIPFSTKIKVPKKYWWTFGKKRNSHNGIFVSDDYYLHENVNRSLQRIEKTFQDIMDVVSITHQQNEINYELIRDYYNTNDYKLKVKVKKPKVMSLVAVMEELLIEKKKESEKNTIKSYQTRINNIKNFLDLTNRQNLSVDEVRYSFLQEFEGYLRGLENEDGTQKLCRNYRNKHITLIRQSLDLAINNEYIAAMPIGKLSLRYDQPKEPHYLLPSQRKLIIECEVPRLEKVRDVAIFLMYTGFSYVDFKGLRSHHLIEGEGFKKSRKKSDIFSLPPLLPEARAIIEKYGSVEKIPKPCMDDFNDLIKVIGSIVGLDESTLGYELSSQDFRDTFCSMMENEYMVEGRTLKFMMGHKTMKQINTYSRMMPKRILHDLRKSNIDIDAPLPVID